MSPWQIVPLPTAVQVSNDGGGGVSAWVTGWPAKTAACGASANRATRTIRSKRMGRGRFMLIFLSLVRCISRITTSRSVARCMRESLLSVPIYISRIGGWQVIVGAEIIAGLLLQKCDQARQIGETAALAGLGALQRRPPDGVPMAAGAPETQQERVIFVRFVRHHDPFRLGRSEGIVTAGYKATIRRSPA